jgi:starvation-inducible DNA-binding protein
MMLDEQSDQIFAMTDVLAERVRKVGHLTLKAVANDAWPVHLEKMHVFGRR